MSKTEAADLVVKSAKIYTLEINKPWAQAVAVRGDRIISTLVDLLGDQMCLTATVNT